jgi:hypothetical protein
MSLEVACPSRADEHALRRCIDVSVSRALFDSKYEQQLLADPTIVLGQQGCTPQQFLELRGIHAHDIKEFACQAVALFWPSADGPARESRPAVAAAAL